MARPPAHVCQENSVVRYLISLLACKIRGTFFSESWVRVLHLYQTTCCRRSSIYSAVKRVPGSDRAWEKCGSVLAPDYTSWFEERAAWRSAIEGSGCTPQAAPQTVCDPRQFAEAGIHRRESHAQAGSAPRSRQPNTNSLSFVHPLTLQTDTGPTLRQARYTGGAMPKTGTSPNFPKIEVVLWFGGGQIMIFDFHHHRHQSIPCANNSGAR
jgi:hypothetical protein